MNKFIAKHLCYFPFQFLRGQDIKNTTSNPDGISEYPILKTGNFNYASIRLENQSTVGSYRKFTATYWNCSILSENVWVCL